jgi:hypothetical protein
MIINRNLCLENLQEIFEDVLYTEEWRDIAGFNGKYQISTFGRVKSMNFYRRKRPLIMKTNPGPCGYRVLRLCQNGRATTHLVHVLVASAFIPNPDDKKTVQHKHYNIDDNRAHQLEWFTSAEQE